MRSPISLRGGALLAAALAAAPALHAQQGGPAPVPLSLARAVQVAADTAPSVRLAGLRVEEGQARVRQARSALLPQLTGTAGNINRTFNSETFGIDFPSAPGAPPSNPEVGPFDVFDARLNLRQPLFDASAWVRTRAAREAAEGTGAERDAAAEAAAQRAASAYLRAARAEALVAARRQDVALADSLLAQARTQVEAGVSTGIDVTRAQSQLVTAQGQLRVAQNAAEQAQIDLARALAVDPTTRFALQDALSAQSAASGAPASADEAVKQALENRAELRAEHLRAQAARTTEKAVRAEALPRVEAVADWGVSGRDVGSSFPTRQVGVQLSVPLVDGLRREARVAEQRAVVREAEVRETDLRAQVEAEVNGALLEIRSGEEQQVVAAERLRLAEEELDQAGERFREGVAGNIEVINAQSALVRARDALIDARFATAVARVNLARSVGTARSVR
jgi:outer membrane protein TolC